jgi:hypothetical protein
MQGVRRPAERDGKPIPTKNGVLLQKRLLKSVARGVPA